MDGCKAFSLKITYSSDFSIEPERSVIPLNKKRGSLYHHKQENLTKRTSPARFQLHKIPRHFPG